MPYQIGLHDAPEQAFDRLVELGALDIEFTGSDVAAVMPDAVSAATVAGVLGIDVAELRVSNARSRDDGSVWVVTPRPIRIGTLQIVSADRPPHAGALRMIDGAAFGTGLHPTTALCLEALHDEVTAWRPASLLDVGTGSGVLALAALAAGVPRVVAIDIDARAVRVAAENARLNALASRLALVQGGPEVLSGAWPLVLANVLAAPLMQLAPTLARRVGHAGRLVLSGIRATLAGDVEQAYRRVAMRVVRTDTRDGWSAATMQASW